MLRRRAHVAIIRLQFLHLLGFLCEPPLLCLEPLGCAHSSSSYRTTAYCLNIFVDKAKKNR